MPAPLLSPLLASLLAQTQDPRPCLSLPSSTSTIRILLEYLASGQEQGVGQEVMELACMLGVTYLTRKIQENAYNEKKPVGTIIPVHIPGDVQGVEERKTPSSIDLSKLTPEAEKYLKEIIQKNKKIKRETTKQMEPLSHKQSDSLNPEVCGHSMPLSVDNSTKEVSQKHGDNEFLKENSIMNHENQISEAQNMADNILVETNIITQNQGQVEVLDSDRGFYRVHKSEKQTCEECGAVLCSKQSLKTHQITKHGREGYKYRCDQCKYQTAIKEGLDKHISTHHDKIRYPCTLCDYKATQKGSLATHTESKHRGAIFRCNVCGKAFSLKQAQRRHTEYKHGQRRYKCDSCEYIAGQVHHLTTHKKLKHRDLVNVD